MVLYRQLLFSDWRGIICWHLFGYECDVEIKWITAEDTNEFENIVWWLYKHFCI
jgi:hypothetical protein